MFDFCIYPNYKLLKHSAHTVGLKHTQTQGTLAMMHWPGIKPATHTATAAPLVYMHCLLVPPASLFPRMTLKCSDFKENVLHQFYDQFSCPLVGKLMVIQRSIAAAIKAQLTVPWLPSNCRLPFHGNTQVNIIYYIFIRFSFIYLFPTK